MSLVDFTFSGVTASGATINHLAGTVEKNSLGQFPLFQVVNVISSGEAFIELLEVEVRIDGNDENQVDVTPRYFLQDLSGQTIKKERIKIPKKLHHPKFDSSTNTVPVWVNGIVSGVVWISGISGSTVF